MAAMMSFPFRRQLIFPDPAGVGLHRRLCLLLVRHHGHQDIVTSLLPSDIPHMMAPDHVPCRWSRGSLI